MTTSTTLVGTWGDGLFVVADGAGVHELAGQPVRGLASDGYGGAFAIVGGTSLRHRSPEGAWDVVASTDVGLSCCVAVGDVLYVGTDDARILSTADGALEPLAGFDEIEGRETWYPGGMVVDGKYLGPPLGVRSITATSDGSVLLASIHVGGIARSTDGGRTWRPTIAVDTDVHEVRAHPDRVGVVAAASAVGLCTSTDAGATWDIERDGLHATHCSAVAFCGDDVLVSASSDPFSEQGAIYRRPATGPGGLVVANTGLPPWLAGIADTYCIDGRSTVAAVADRGGNVYVSDDAARTWSQRADGLPAPSGILVI